MKKVMKNRSYNYRPRHRNGHKYTKYSIPR